MNNDDFVRYMLERSMRPSWERISRVPDFSITEFIIDGQKQVDPAQGEPEPAADKDKQEVKGVTWDDIGGQEEAKRQMMEAIELPFTHKEVFAFYGKKPPKGILLYGPPGCGKTMFGKAAATALAKLHGRPVDDGAFIYVKAPEIQDKYVGESEKKIRQLFEDAREYREEHGCPAVIFVDEADAILINRSRGSRYDASLVASFLTEMDGLEECGAIVILATNRPDAIDPAIVRDGRIDRKIKIDRPGIKEGESILRMNLNAVPMKGTTPAGLARLMAREFFSDHRVIFRLHTDGGVHHLTLAHVVNGAMLAGAVDQASSLALHRDLLRKTQTGLRKADAIRAIDGIQRQQLDLDHSDAARDLIEALGGKLLRVEKMPVAVRTNVAELVLAGPVNIFEDAA